MRNEVSNGYKTPSVVDVDKEDYTQPPIERIINKTDVHLESLLQAVNQLEARLEFVMKEGLKAQNGEMSKSVASSHLAQRLGIIDAIVEVLVSRIDSIRDRLEV